MVNASPGQPLVLVLMGVSGCGKSTVAGLLAGPSKRVTTCTPRPMSRRWRLGTHSMTRTGGRGWRRSLSGSVNISTLESRASSPARR
jgi:ABC-type glutathione transport system ATPase component